MTGPAPDDGPDGTLGEPSRLGRNELRGDLPVAGVVAAAAGARGRGIGLLWALLAPSPPLVLLGDRSTPLLPESGGGFDATAAFVLLALALGVLTGGLAWRRRLRRGPVVLLGAVLGSLAGAWLAARVGVWLAPATAPVDVLLDRALISADGRPGPPVPALLGAAPAVLGSWWAVICGGLGAALAYLIPAIVLGDEDLGRPPTP